MAEIIRCKDCRYLKQWRTSEQAEKFGQIYDCELDILTCPSPDDYCSKAERKETSNMITQVRCPYCHTYWENVSIPKDIWAHGKFVCPKCAEKFNTTRGGINGSKNQP